MDTLIKLLTEHVYLILFVSLILEFVALPIPGETMMALAGVMGYNGLANYWLMIIAGSLGTIIGMQLSYEVGRRLGRRAIDKYGKYIGLTKPRMLQASKFFNKYGNIVIFIAYYLPGVRHILGYFSGISRIDAKKFHIYSTIGGIVWVFTFITMGYILGPSWKHVFHLMHKYGFLALLIAGICLIIYLIYIKLGKKEFISYMKKSVKFLIPILILIGVADFLIIDELDKKRNYEIPELHKKTMEMVDTVLYVSFGILFLIMLIMYLRIAFKNQTSEKLLVVVDYQNDFVDGSLAIEDAKNLEPIIEEKIKFYLEQNQDVIFTLDSHDIDYLETREGVSIPVLHCQKETLGHELYGNIKNYKEKAKRVFEKDTFGSINLAKFIAKSDYKEIEFCGVVSNICVLSNIILVQNMNKEVEIIVDLSATISNDKVVNETFETYLNGLGIKIK